MHSPARTRCTSGCSSMTSVTMCRRLSAEATVPMPSPMHSAAELDGRKRTAAACAALHLAGWPVAKRMNREAAHTLQRAWRGAHTQALSQQRLCSGKACPTYQPPNTNHRPTNQPLKKWGLLGLCSLLVVHFPKGSSV
eukprot:352038-Chlamydomonas_euryale.AAC.3